MTKPLRVCSARWSNFYGWRRFLVTVLGCAAMAILVTASVSACSSGPSSTPPSIPPGGTGSATSAPPASGGTPSGPTSSGTPSAPTPSGTPSTPTPGASTPSPSPPSSPSSPAHPLSPGAPGTGGGGTAGFQHVLVFCLGALAILAGAGAIAYRRKVTR